MSNTVTCPRCGAPVETPAATCSACLLALAGESPPGQRLGPAFLDDLPLPKDAVLIAGKYEVLDTLARGGMGIVYRARSLDLKRTVALKMIRGGRLATPDEMRRFRTEAEAAAHLEHAHIVPIYEVGEHDGEPFFAMRLVEGASLANRIAADEFRITRENARAMQARIAQLMAKVATAVHHAHQRGVLHRDLKPANVLLDEHGEPLLTDFGLAKLLELDDQSDAHPTQSQAVLGTPSYMAPEQAAGKSREVTTAADVYSLGAILYELLTGRPPFTAETPAATMWQVINQEPARPTSLLREVVGDLEVVCLKCLEKDPNRRYPSAEALAQDLERWLRHEPIHARPSGLWSQACKWARRKPAIAALVAALACVVIAGLGGILWQLKQTRLEAARTLQVSLFLKNIIQGMDPDVANGRDTTLLREITDRAAARLDREMKNQPYVEAGVRSTLGQAYLHLAEYERAEQMHRRAVDVMRQLHPKDHADKATAMDMLASTLTRRNKLQEADSLYQEVLAMRRRLFGEQHPSVADTLHNLAMAARQRGQYVEAENLFRRSLELHRKLLGPTHEHTANSLDNLGGLLILVDRPAEALKLFQEALAIRRVLYGQKHSAVAVSLDHIGLALAKLDRSAEAVDWHRQALAVRTNLFGLQHPTTAQSLVNLAGILSKLGQFAEADSCFQKSLAILTNRNSRFDPDVARSLINLGASFEKQRKYDDAEAVMLQALDIQKRTLPASHPETAVTCFNLGVIHQAQRRPAEAEKNFRDALAVHELQPKNNPAQMAGILARLGEVLREQRRLGEAESYLVRSLELRRALYPQPNLQVGHSIEQLAIVRWLSTNLAGAEVLYRELQHIFEAVHGTNSAKAATGLEAIAQALMMQEKYAESEVEYRAALARWSKVANARPSQTVPALKALAIVQSQQGDTNGAEATLKLALQRVSGTKPDDPEIAVINGLLNKLGTKDVGGPVSPTSEQGSSAAQTRHECTNALAQAALFIAKGQCKEAEPLARFAMTNLASLSTNYWRTFDAESHLGASLAGQNRLDEAEPYLLSGYNGLVATARAISVPGKPPLRQAIQRLVQFYESKKDEAKAAEFIQKLADFDRSAAKSPDP